MEENKTMEMEVMNDDEVMDTYETEETSGKGLGVVAVGAVLAAVGVGIAVARKNKGKLDEWRIRRLEKKGYVVTKPEDVVETEAEVVDFPDEETEK